MATQVIVFVCLNDGTSRRQPFVVRVKEDAFVSQLVEAALLIEKVNIGADRVSVHSTDGNDVRLVDKVSDVLAKGYGNTPDNILQLDIPDEGPEPKKSKTAGHTTLSVAPSAFASRTSSEISKKVHGSPLYSHWFAMEIYNEFERLKGNTTLDTDTVRLNGHSCMIPDSSLQNLVEQFEKISVMADQPLHSEGVMSKEQVRSAEQTHPALYARALDRFLFCDAEMDKGACLHQLPVHRDGNSIPKPDLFIVELMYGLPCHPVALSDVKIANMKKAQAETSAYCIKAIELESDSEWNVLLGLAIAADKAQLSVVVEDDGFVREVAVCSAGFTDRHAHSFFRVLYGAVHSLLKYRIFEDQAGVVPIPNINFIDVLDYCRGRDARVFCDSENMVYKLYDDQFHKYLLPNFEAIKSIDSEYLPEMKLHSLTDDLRVQCLEYRYIGGIQQPQSTRQFAIIVKDLRKLHDNGYVHGDIRKENLLFSVDGNRAWMIDFDLAGKEGTAYPATYNHISIPERHREARRTKEKQKVHDWYALSVCLRESFRNKPNISDIVQLLCKPDPDIASILNLLQ